MKIYSVYAGYHTEHFLHEPHARKYAQMMGGEIETFNVNEDLPSFYTNYDMIAELDEQGKIHTREETRRTTNKPDPVEYFNSSIDTTGSSKNLHKGGFVNVSGGDKKAVQQKFDELLDMLQTIVEIQNG